MSEARLFTVDEANALIGRLAPLLERLKDAQETITRHQDQLEARSRGNGGGPEGAEFLRAMSDAGAALGDLEAAGVIVRDPATGLIDFASEREGMRVYLCWRLGEDSVAWWHPEGTGFADRRPL